MIVLVYDVIIIALLVLFAVWGWHKGFLLSLCGLAAAVAAFLGAGLLSNILAPPIADTLAPKLEETMESRIADYYEDSGITDEMDALREEGGLFAWAADAVEDELIEPGMEEIAASAAQFAAQRIAYSAVFVLAFIVLYILLVVLIHGLNLVTKLPVLRFCNGLGGGAVGLVKGVLIVFVSTAALMASSLQPDAQTLSNSYLLRFFVECNPILTLLGG